MAEASEIIEYAHTLFDAVGIDRLPSGGFMLILGLESTPERDLDEFGRAHGRFMMYGFEKHAGPRLESLLDFIRAAGYSADLAGPYGYPLEGEINLKQAAIRAGMGLRGKSSVVLHPEFGHHLRLMAVLTDAPLQAFIGPPGQEEASPFCRDCSVCIDICPVSVLEPYRMTDPARCLSNITPLGKDGRSLLCDLCLKECPAAGSHQP